MIKGSPREESDSVPVCGNSAAGLDCADAIPLQARRPVRWSYKVSIQEDADTGPGRNPILFHGSPAAADHRWRVDSCTLRCRYPRMRKQLGLYETLHLENAPFA